MSANFPTGGGGGSRTFLARSILSSSICASSSRCRLVCLQCMIVSFPGQTHNKEITVFKIFIWGGISSDMVGNLVLLRRYTSPNENFEYDI